MTALETAWKEALKAFDQEIGQIGAENALIIWIHGGEVALDMQLQTIKQIRQQQQALASKGLRMARARPKAKRK
jgi:hypothetical protein